MKTVDSVVQHSLQWSINSSKVFQTLIDPPKHRIGQQDILPRRTCPGSIFLVGTILDMHTIRRGERLRGPIPRGSLSISQVVVCARCAPVVIVAIMALSSNRRKNRPFDCYKIRTVLSWHWWRKQWTRWNTSPLCPLPACPLPIYSAHLLLIILVDIVIICYILIQHCFPCIPYSISPEYCYLVY